MFSDACSEQHAALGTTGTLSSKCYTHPSACHLPQKYKKTHFPSTGDKNNSQLFIYICIIYIFIYVPLHSEGQATLQYKATLKYYILWSSYFFSF